MDLVIALLSAFGVGGVVGYIVKYHLDQLTENKRKMREAKERQYKDLLSNMLAFFTGWENGDQKRQFMWEVYTSAPVYASDKIIRLAHKFIKSHSTDNPEHLNSDEIYVELVLEIRRELNKIQGAPDSKLSTRDITISKLND